MRSLLRLIPYLRRYKKSLFFGILTIIGSNIFNALQPKILGYAVDALGIGIRQGSLRSTNLFLYASLIVLFAVIAGICTYLTRQTIIVTSRHIEYDLRNDFLAHLQKLPYSYFQNTSTGDLMAHATNDIGAVRNVLGPGIMYPTDTFLTLTMVLTMMLTSNVSLTLISLIPLPLVLVVVYQLGKRINSKFTERQEQYSQLTSYVQETLAGIRVIQSYGRENFVEQQFNGLSKKYRKKNMELAIVQAILWPLMFLLVGISLILILYFGGLKVIAGTISIGTLMAFITYLSMLIWPMIAFGWITNILQQGSASMERLGKIFDTEPEIRNTESTDFSIASITGNIEFKNVTFRYPNTNTNALTNISFSIPAGSSLAIVGHTGAGKSTLVHLIPRLYDVTEGKILIDGIPVQRIPLETLRSHIGFVPQETFLFSDTISANIRYGSPDDSATDEEIRRVAEIASIAPDIEQFPNKYETMIGERGITLSGGQKQRTSIARALLRHPSILILDDALSAVDTYTEDRILHRLRKEMEGRTSILISHRISTVKDADLILVLEKGTIQERGNHEELLALNGIYADLYKRQLLEEELETL